MIPHVWYVNVWSHDRKQPSHGLSQSLSDHRSMIAVSGRAGSVDSVKAMGMTGGRALVRPWRFESALEFDGEWRREVLREWLEMLTSTAAPVSRTMEALKTLAVSRPINSFKKSDWTNYPINL
jgi:hypothetical protein